MHKTTEIDFGSTIKGIRETLELTQEELARELDVTDSTVSSWERNKTFPNERNFARILELLKN